MKRAETLKDERRWKNKFLFLLLIIIFIFVSINLVRGWKNSRQVNQEITDLKQEVKNLEKDNLELTELIEYFNSDAYIEKKARIDLGLKKEGERVVVVNNQENNPTKQQSNTEEGEQKLKSNLQEWWRYLFK